MKARIDKLYFYLLCLFAFSIPFAGFHIPKYVLGGLILLKIFIIIKDVKDFQSIVIKKKKVLMALLICPISISITMLYSTDTVTGLSLLGRYSFCFILPFVFLVKNDNKVLVYSVLSYAAGAFALILLNFILIVVKWDEPVFYSYSKFYYQNLSSYVALHPGYYSLIISSALFVILVYLKSKIKLLAVSLCAIILFLLSSKGIIILSFVGIAVWLYHNTIKQKNRFRNISGWIILSFFLSFFLTQTHIFKRIKQSYISFQNVSSVYEDPNNRLDENLLRFFLFKYSIDTIKKNNYSALFGYGIGDYQKELLTTYEEEKYGFGLHYRYNSHNQYLTTTLMSGIVGLIIFIVYLLTPIIFGNMENVLSGIFVLILFGYAFLESYFSREIGILISSFFITILSMLQLRCSKKHQKFIM
ncbi:O-antigen ligase family protein [uncultured Croceitalea sp.]|uniref:O-antigen ligase family protein n=1 Tax=uncultured Croceitalea sp. TaxID=1798908 RepID=UPI003305F9F4